MAQQGHDYEVTLTQEEYEVFQQLREQFNEDELAVVRRGNRLSIVPVPEPTAVRLLSSLGPLR